VTDLGVEIDALRDEASSPRVPLPSDLEEAYGGPLRLPDEVVYANFVSSIDGVAAVVGVRASSALISGGVPSDRFVMALLRSVADVVIVGSGTLREHDGPWTAEHAFPRAAERFTRSRSDRSAAPAPRLVVTTATGELPVDHPALVSAVVATTSGGARTIAGRSVRPLDVIDFGDAEQVDPGALVSALRERGFRRILTEGGPGWMGSMLAASAVNELFLTLAPKLLGGADGRTPLSGDSDLLQVAHDMRLLGIRTSGSHLFLRYTRTSARR
jgi:riboflavin biosynthesis pyrimidine reductase